MSSADDDVRATTSLDSAPTPGEPGSSEQGSSADPSAGPGAPSAGPTDAPAGRGSIASVVVGTVALSLTNMVMAVGLAALIFVGPLADGLPRSIGVFMLGSAIVGGFVAWKSGSRLVVAGSQDVGALVLISVTASIIAKSDGDPVVDFFVLLGCAALITGIAMVVVGRFGMGRVVRYLPTTVVAGFIAGTGWLLFKGGIDIMTDRGLGFGDIDDLFTIDLAKLWLPGLLLGIAMVAAGKLPQIPPPTVAVLILAATILFYVVVAATSSLSAVDDGGWLIGTFDVSASVRAITPGELGSASWGALFGSTGAIITVIVTSMVGLLLNLSGLEYLNREQLDLDHEIQVAGASNVLVAPFGALVGFHLLGDTALAKRMGVTSKIVPAGVAAVVAVVALVGGELIGYVPRLVAGGVISGVGLGLLVDWAIGLRRTVSWSDRLLSVGILLVIAAVGIIEGVVAGVIVACAMFVLRYSRIDPIRRQSSGRDLLSRVDRSRSDAAFLQSDPNRIVVFHLQGYLFFGSTAALAESVRRRCQDAESRPQTAILDFRRVTGIDASGYSVLEILADDLAMLGTRLVWAGLTDRLRSPLDRSRPDLLVAGQTFPDVDAALEAAEDHALAGRAVDDVDEYGAELESLSPALLAAFTPVDLAAEERVIGQGELGDTLTIVVSGTLSVFQESNDGSRHRLRRLGPGALVGEISFLTGGIANASVLADTAATVLQLSRDDYESLRHRRPDLALELHDFVLRGSIERIVSLNRSLTSGLL